MILTDKRRTNKQAATRVGRLMVGTVFSGQIGDTTSVFLKAFGSIVDLVNPANAWDNTTSLNVEDYVEVKATLIVEDM